MSHTPAPSPSFQLTQIVASKSLLLNPPLAYSVQIAPKLFSLTQTSLDSIVKHEPKVPLFSNAGLIDHIIELIVCEDEVSRYQYLYVVSFALNFFHIQAFRLVERGSFRRLLKFCRPSLSEKDIPSRNTFRAEVLRHVQLAKGRMRDSMKKLPSKISFTFDAWTSEPGDPFLSVTAHYIDAPVDQPNAWRVRCEQLMFTEIKGRHTAKNMGDMLAHMVNDYDLHGKVMAHHITLSNSFQIRAGGLVHQ